MPWTEDSDEPSPRTREGNEARLSIYHLGRCSAGAWVVRSDDGRVAGLFRTRADAVRFLKHDTGRPDPRIVETSEPIEFDFGAPTPRSRAA